MGRKLRYAPEGGALFEITDRTIQGRPLFRPSRELNEIVLGVLGRAQRLYEVSLCSFVMLSGHYHMLVRVRDARQLAEFMQYFNGNLAKGIARLTGWKATIFPRRYQAIQVSDEEEAQVERLRCVADSTQQVLQEGRGSQSKPRSPASLPSHFRPPPPRY